MKHATSEAKVLVASDNAADARQIQHQLTEHFDNLSLSTDPDRSVLDFKHHLPDVLVLAFDRLDKAQSYYLGLYRLGGVIQDHPHRTVVLCSKDEVQAVFELCKQAYFDDYVLYWPLTHDGPRLVMSVWNVCRDMKAPSAGSVRPAELFAHARHVGELDRILVHELDVAARQEPGGTTVNAWARHIKGVIEPSLAGTRLLGEQVRRVRPTVMAVEDDEFARMLVGRALDPGRWDVVYAADGAAALALLRRQRPDVILMDIGLPGLDGLTLTQQLKSSAHWGDVPVVMMTGDARKDTLVSSVGAGASGFLVKPFTRESLTAKLEAVLSR